MRGLQTIVSFSASFAPVLMAIALIAPSVAKGDTFTVTEYTDGSCAVVHTGSDSTSSSGCTWLSITSVDGAVNYTIGGDQIRLGDANGMLSDVLASGESFGTNEISFFLEDYAGLTPCWACNLESSGPYVMLADWSNGIGIRTDAVVYWLDQPTAIPEPATLLLFSTGLCLSGIVKRQHGRA